jgi:hypothetical protein
MPVRNRSGATRSRRKWLGSARSRAQRVPTVGSEVGSLRDWVVSKSNVVSVRHQDRGRVHSTEIRE